MCISCIFSKYLHYTIFANHKMYISCIFSKYLNYTIIAFCGMLCSFEGIQSSEIHSMATVQQNPFWFFCLAGRWGADTLFSFHVKPPNFRTTSHFLPSPQTSFPSQKRGSILGREKSHFSSLHTKINSGETRRISATIPPPPKKKQRPAFWSLLRNLFLLQEWTVSHD